jgi:hypothetical protein
MSEKRLRKIALYLEYIAFILKEEADNHGRKNARKRRGLKAERDSLLSQMEQFSHPERFKDLP